MDLSKIPGVESESIDLEKFHKKSAKIESVEVKQVKSKYTSLVEGTPEHHKQWVLQITSVVLETVGEGDNKIEFRASGLINLNQDDQGNLIGFPKGDKSNLGKFCKDLRINLDKLENLQQVVDVIKGKEATVKAYEKEVEKDGKSYTQTYLTFLY